MTLDRSIAIAVPSTFWASESECHIHIRENLSSPSSCWRISLIVYFDWPKYYAITSAVTKGNSSRKSERAFPKTWGGWPGLDWSWHERSPISKRARYSLIWISEQDVEPSTAINSLWISLEPRLLRKKNLTTNLCSDFSIWRNNAVLTSCRSWLWPSRFCMAYYGKLFKYEMIRHLCPYK
jgi:hypothetical protein